MTLLDLLLLVFNRPEYDARQIDWRFIKWCEANGQPYHGAFQKFAPTEGLAPSRTGLRFFDPHQCVHILPREYQAKSKAMASAVECVKRKYFPTHLEKSRAYQQHQMYLEGQNRRVKNARDPVASSKGQARSKRRRRCSACLTGGSSFGLTKTGSIVGGPRTCVVCGGTGMVEQ
ncbi:hypothetical protein [Novosphingobium marinum]|uniref:hypothetical protein n=1 Tax=Novosphingobium marinum TaxID=1514948 RepID=UPI001667B7C5|nr:hypothetical protein [Novosphingobium marinum]